MLCGLAAYSLPMHLSDEERERIRLSEEYRAEVRATLAPPSKESWLDKLAVPLLIVLVSGLLIPWILERVADSHRAFELQSRLIEQIVGDDAAAQVNLIQFRSQVRNHWFEFLKIQFEKRLVALQESDAAERQARREELQQDLARERTQFDAAFAEAMAGSTKAVVEQQGNGEWVRLHYGTPDVLQRYVAIAKKEHDAGWAGVAAFQKQLAEQSQKPSEALRDCPDEAACQAIFREAAARMEQLGGPQPQFKEWDDARRALIQFISETRPRL